MNKDAISEIEANVKEARKIANIGAALERLKSTRDFKMVIQSGYFEAEAIRLVHLKADAQFQTKDRQESIIKQIDAIGALSSYLYTVEHSASLAQKAIESDEAMLSELLAEELGNG